METVVGKEGKRVEIMGGPFVGVTGVIRRVKRCKRVVVEIEGELKVNSVRKESLLTAANGKKYRTKFYNLDVIISVGYRVKSPVGTRFRQWACGYETAPLGAGFIKYYK